MHESPHGYSRLGLVPGRQLHGFEKGGGGVQLRARARQCSASTLYRRDVEVPAGCMQDQPDRQGLVLRDARQRLTDYVVPGAPTWTRASEGAGGRKGQEGVAIASLTD